MAGEGPRVELDLDELGSRATMNISPTEIAELLRRARQLEKVEAFLREHAETVKTGLAGLNEGGPAYRALRQLLRSLGLDKETR